MNLQRRSLFGISFLTWVVLGLGVLSGAAMATERIQLPGVEKAPTTIPQQGTYRVPSPQTPAIPAIPAVPRFEPTAQPPAAVPSQRPNMAQPDPSAPLAHQQPTSQSPHKTVVDASQTGESIRFFDSKPAPDLQPQVQQAQGMGIGMKLFLILLVLLGAAFAIHVLNQKNTADTPQPADNTLELASTIRLGGRWQVSLIRVPGRMLVVGATENGLNLLAELDPETDNVEEEWLEEFKEVSLDTPSAPPKAEFGTYSRPPVQSHQEEEEFPEILQKAVGAEDCDPSNDAYLDHLMQRLAKARPAVVRSSAPADERASLRKRVRSYQRGPTRL